MFLLVEDGHFELGSVEVSELPGLHQQSHLAAHVQPE